MTAPDDAALRLFLLALHAAETGEVAVFKRETKNAYRRMPTAGRLSLVARLAMIAAMFARRASAEARGQTIADLRDASGLDDDQRREIVAAFDRARHKEPTR